MNLRHFFDDQPRPLVLLRFVTASVIGSHAASSGRRAMDNSALPFLKRIFSFFFVFCLQQQILPVRSVDSAAPMLRRVPPPPPPRSGPSAVRPIPAPKPAKLVSGAEPSGRIVKTSLKENQPAVAVANNPPTSSAAANGYLETRYAYSVNGILGSAAQASAAAAFFARSVFSHFFSLFLTAAHNAQGRGAERHLSSQVN